MKMPTIPSRVLVIIAIVLIAVPVVVAWGVGSVGTDDQARVAVTRMDPSFEPWFSIPWARPGAELESLLFTAQAALGTAFIGYFIGYRRGRQQAKGS